MRARGRGSASQRASAGAAGRCSPPLLPAPPHPRPRPQPAARARGAAPRPDGRSPPRGLGGCSAARPAASSPPSQPARAPLPARALPPLLLLLLSLLPSRAADRQPRRGECRYFAFRIICRTQASFRSALYFLRPLPPPSGKEDPTFETDSTRSTLPKPKPDGLLCACCPFLQFIPGLCGIGRQFFI